jgi:hypothetical protein
MSKKAFAFIAAAALLTGLAAGPVAFSVFQGGTTGTPIPFDPIPLPEVVVGPLNDPAPLSSIAFVPTFDHLTGSETVIRTEAEWRQVWRRLFNGTPYDPSLVDFQTHFVVLMGGGLMSPVISFSITSVEQFEATFSSPDWFFGDSIVPKLAISSTTVFPGVKPDPDVVGPPFHHLSAVKIPIEFEADVNFHRGIIALP